MMKANVLCWDLWHVNHHMIISPLNELVEAKHASSWAILCVQGIIKDFVVDNTTDSITNIQGRDHRRTSHAPVHTNIIMHC